MASLVTLDTNVLLYAVDQNDPVRQAIAADVLARAIPGRTFITTIALGEFCHAAPRKLGLSRTAVRRRLADLVALFPTRSYALSDVTRAAAENEAGRFAVWDAVLLSCAEQAGCTVCLSEDMQDGARLGNITVRNPFGAKGLSAAAAAALAP